MAYKPPLESDCVYHIYNRGIDSCRLFYQPDHYTYFLEKYAYYIPPIADTLAYCLMGNHFHFLVRIKSEAARTVLREKPSPKGKYITLNPSRQIGHLCNSYAQTINHRLNRTGALFEEDFERKKVDSEQYFTNMIEYIHRNPQKHGIYEDFMDYPYSSYQSHLSQKPTRLARKEVLDWFGGTNEYQKFHQEMQDWRLIEKYIIEFD